MSKWLWITLCIFGTGAALALFLFDPTQALLFPPCFFHLLTGLYCPGCGSLRATHALLNGRLIQAVGFNSLLIAALPVSVGVWLHDRRPGRRLTSQTFFPVMVLIVIVVFGVLRNIPIFPLTLLAPH